MKRALYSFDHSPLASVALLLILGVLLMPMALASEDDEESTEHESASHEQGHGGILPLLTGVVALILSTILIVANKFMPLARNKSILPAAIFALSLGAGIIHLLLIEAHMAEAFAWGVFFTVVGILQAAYGFAFLKWQGTKMHYAGILLNAAVVLVYVLVRIFVPPFSPTGLPVDELDMTGLLANIIEIATIVALVYNLRKNR